MNKKINLQGHELPLWNDYVLTKEIGLLSQIKPGDTLLIPKRRITNEHYEGKYFSTDTLGVDIYETLFVDETFSILPGKLNIIIQSKQRTGILTAFHLKEIESIKYFLNLKFIPVKNFSDEKNELYINNVVHFKGFFSGEIIRSVENLGNFHYISSEGIDNIKNELKGKRRKKDHYCFPH